MNAARTLWDLAEARANATPELVFAIDESERRLDYRGLRDAALRAAAGLHALGIGEGTPVSWLLPTRIEAFVLMLALARLGAVQNPLVPIYREREAGFCLRQTGARWLLVPDRSRGFDYTEMARKLAEALPGLRVVPIGAGLPEGDPARLGPAPRAPDTPEAAPVRWIFYTSGTTADPRGARHTDLAILISSRGLADALELAPGDRCAVVFPVTHLGGANALVASLYSGSTQLVVESFDPGTSIPFLAAHGVTHAGAGPAFFRAYLEAQRAAGPASIFPAIRAFYGGGAPKTAALHRALADEIGGVGIVSTWGMTEAALLSIARIRDPDAKLAHSEGRPSPQGTRIRVVRPDGSDAAPGEDGELRVRAPQLMRGYVDASLDAAAFDERGFFRTGDLGHLDPEGYVVVSGRQKDVIIRKGENISAAELEGLLQGHPKVADVAVVGLPDPERGERCCAVVVCRDAGDPLRFEELVAYLEQHRLMRQKIPEQLEIVDALPRNPSGKVVKRRLQERFANSRS